MHASRRDFFKVAAVGSVAATVFGFNPKPAYAKLKELKIARANETRSTCPYGAVGCGVLIRLSTDSHPQHDERCHEDGCLPDRVRRTSTSAAITEMVSE